MSEFDTIEDIINSDPESLRATTDDIMKTAFEISNGLIEPFIGLPPAHREVIKQNNMDVYLVVIGLLSSAPEEVLYKEGYWVQ